MHGRRRLLAGAAPRAALATAAAAMILSSCGGLKPPAPTPTGPEIVVATKGSEPDAYEQRLAGILRILGFVVRTAPVVEATANVSSTVFIPWATSRSLGAARIKKIHSLVERGLRVAVEGPSRLAATLGVRFRPLEKTVSGGRGSVRYELDAVWYSPVRVTLFEADGPASFLAKGGTPLEAEGAVGRGRYIYLSLPVIADDGQVRYPGLGEMLRSALGIAPAPLQRSAAEVYFDPAYRHAVRAVELADLWARRGIRVVHVAGWYGAGQYAYRPLVEALHAQSLRAYLWLAPPMVTKAVWDAHPECRERSAMGAEAKGDWRSLFALEDPSCMKIAQDVYAKMTDAADWDGATIGELYFDGPGFGPDRPDLYTPFHSSVRAEFKRRRGVDPVEIFDRSSPHWREREPAGLAAFESYRRDLAVRLHRELLAFLQRRLPGRDLVVTLVDDVLDGNIARNIGVLPEQVLGLKSGFRVHAEDPFTMWGKPPERYTKLRETWDKRGTDYVVDINVVDRDDRNPTKRIGGVELARAVAAAAPNGWIALYNESSVYAADWDVVSTALASKATLQRDGAGYVVESDRAVEFRIPRGWTWVAVDGKPWPLGERGSVLVPPGRHSLQRSAKPAGPRVPRTSCELLASDGVSLTVESPSLCYVVFADGNVRRAGAGKQTVPLR